MITTRPNQYGFSAVELLITLFIAAIFLLAGYQLYAYVYQRGTEASQASEASMIAYKYLREWQDKTQTGACTSAVPVNDTPVTSTSLSGGKVTVTITCPFSAPIQGISLIRVDVTYTGPSQTEKVSHAGYSY